MDTSPAHDRATACRSPLAEEAPTGRWRETGASRGASRLSAPARAVGFAAVLGLFGSGAASSVPGSSAPPGRPYRAPLHLDRVTTAADTRKPLAAPETPVPESPRAPMVPTPEAQPASMVAPPVDRPIVAPAWLPARPRAPRAVYGSGPKEGGVWAVVVGIDDYPGSDADLQAAVADARDVDQALAAYGVPTDHRLLLLDEAATADNIRAALGWMASRAAADSTAVFFYSGHGRQTTSAGDRDAEAVDEAMVAADGGNVDDGQVAAILRDLEARSAWIGIASCYGGGFDDALAPGRVLTAAAGENDLAYENSSLGRSYLVEYMVRRAMLEGNASDSVQDAFAWARAQIARDYPNRQPVILDRSRGPVVLGPRAAPTAATAPEGQRRPPAQAEPQPDRPPSPAAPPPPAEPGEPGEPGSGLCTQVLGVTICSGQRFQHSAPKPLARPAPVSSS